MDEHARISKFKGLRQELQESAEARVVFDFEGVAQSYRVFLGNERELRESLVHHSNLEVAISLWDVENREGLDNFLDEVVRLLHNYLAAAGTLRDHSRRLWQKHLPSDPEYDERVKATFADSPLCVFVQDLRNYSLHNQLPVAHGHMTWGTDHGLTPSVKVRKESLLESWEWKSLAKEYLSSLEKEWIDLLELIQAYTDTVTHFNDWLAKIFVERRVEAFVFVQRKKAELAAVLRGEGGIGS